MAKRPLGITVLEAARERISWTFDTFAKVSVSFSAGKDSTVMLHLVMEEARRRNRRVGLLLIDLEAQYKLTIDHARLCYDRYSDLIDPYWVSLPIHLRNAVSQFETHWLCWDPDRRADWVREPDPKWSITDESMFPFFRRGMEFEEFVPAFAEWYSGGLGCATFVGIRSDESLNRYRTIASATKQSFDGRKYTTWKGGTVVNVYPIYDWRTEDIWTYHARYPEQPYNKLYDLMYQAGLTIHQSRICQPYGDDQRRGLWLYHIIEPETWGRVVARVNGANTGALYVQERGNISGNNKVTLPNGHTWQSFAELLLSTLPPVTADHYRNKVAVFIHWWHDRGFFDGIPDEIDPELEAAHKAPSWRRVCKAILRNDYWCKGLSFSQHKSGAYTKYLSVMKKRRARWGMWA